MTRKKQIIQAAHEYINSDAVTPENMLLAYGDFINGAKWADAHQPQVAYFEHEIERLKSKLQSADDLNTLLTAELEKAKSQWISVEDRMPEKSVGYFSQWVLCRYKRGSRIYYHVGMYDYEFEEWSIANVTHWMPIPEL